MPDDRMLHRCQGNSSKLAQCDHLAYRVWTQYLLSSDDFGIMVDEAAKIRGDNLALMKETEDEIRRCLNLLLSLGLVTRFEHQGQGYLCSEEWQDYQGIAYPRKSYLPVPPPEVLQKCSQKTQELFEKTSENQKAKARDGYRLTAKGSTSSSLPPAPVTPTPDAGAFWEEWREAWSSGTRRPLPKALTPTAIEWGECVKVAARFPDPDWRRLMLRIFFETQNDDIRAKPPTLGWFRYWADWIDGELRKKGRKPKLEAA